MAVTAAGPKSEVTIYPADEQGDVYGDVIELPPPAEKGTGSALKGDPAPPLDNEIADMPAEDVAIWLSGFMAKQTEGRMKSAEMNARVSISQREVNSVQQILRYDEARAAASKKSSGGFFKKLLNFVAKIALAVVAVAALIVAIGATAVSGPAGVALMVLAGTFAAMAVTDLAGEISKEAGGPSFSSTGASTKALSGMLQSFGVSKEKAEAIAGKLVMAIMIAMAVAMLALSFGASMGTVMSNVGRAIANAGSKAIAAVRAAVTGFAATGSVNGAMAAASAARAASSAAAAAAAATRSATSAVTTAAELSERATKIVKFAKAVEAGGTIVAAASTGAVAGIEYNEAKFTSKMLKKQAAAEMIQALIDRLTDVIEENLDDFKAAQTADTRNRKTVVDTEKGVSDARESILGNIGSFRMV